MADSEQGDDAAPELAHLLTRYRAGSLSRRDLLAGIARLAGGAAAAAMLLPILESQDATAAPARAVALSLQEMSDRLEIQRNVWDYSNAIDLRAWHLLDAVLADDAELFLGDQARNRADAVAWLKERFTRPDLHGYVHMMVPSRIILAGDAADSLTRCLNPVELVLPDQRHVAHYDFHCFHFQHVRTARGWRIRRRLSAEEPRALRWETPPFNAVRGNPPKPYREA